MTALMAYLDYTYDNGCFPDSGATNHVTAEPSNLLQGTEYNGTNQLHVGNGAGLFIKMIGTTFIKSPVKPSISVALNDMLLVPNITKNLVSVSKFARDNHIFFEFHANYCCMKSQGTKEVLLEGILREDGLHCFKDFQPLHLQQSSKTDFPSVLNNSENSKSVFVSSKSCTSPYMMWNLRLGHPYHSIVHSILQKCNMHHINRTQIDFCNSCRVSKSHRLPTIKSYTEYSAPLELLFVDV